MKRVDKIIGKLEKQAVQLREAGQAEMDNSEVLMKKAQKCYARPDEFMEMVQKVVSYLYLLVKKYNAIAVHKAQDLTRQAGEADERAKRAFRVADRFEKLTK